MGSTPTSAIRSRAPSRGPTATTPLLQRGNGGSIPSGTTRTRRSAGAPAARLRGKEGDRVRLSGRPWQRTVGSSNGTTPALHAGTTPEGFSPGSAPRLSTSAIAGCWSNGTTPVSHAGNRGSTPRLSTVRIEGSWSNGTTPPWRGGDPGSTPGGSNRDGEGSRIRLAGPRC